MSSIRSLTMRKGLISIWIGLLGPPLSSIPSLEDFSRWTNDNGLLTLYDISIWDRSRIGGVGKLFIPLEILTNHSMNSFLFYIENIPLTDGPRTPLVGDVRESTQRRLPGFAY